jgi:hypothetical protein
MELLQELLQINEAKPRRAWDGRLKKIDKLLWWMYDKGILNKTDQKKKDSVFHQYYRWYNDGDLPAAVRGMGVRKWNEKRVEEELEKYLEEFIKSMLAKYMPKINRKEFRIDTAIKDLLTVKDVADNKDAHGLLNYWLKTVKIEDEAGDLVKLVDELEKKYNALDNVTKKADPKHGDYSILYRRDKMKEAGTWTDKMEPQYDEVAKLTGEISSFIGNVIEGLKKLQAEFKK